ncbi:hypothetical protein L210DRAFT_3643456 [Boletus edulis BED1]|uniref:CHAT domain-containing protein n=1 Tax=Boletus edulis BED1 TaxID=1328754 RepID=A0AAD4GHC5_BOLED|nr:hypothetical protein L210DRAFT_3643456 [Boletus edulis BED1]
MESSTPPCSTLTDGIQTSSASSPSPQYAGQEQGKPGRLNNLGRSFRARFKRLGELRDLEDAISTHMDAIHLTPDGHPDRPHCLNNLGNSFKARFKRLGELVISKMPFRHTEMPLSSFLMVTLTSWVLRDLEVAISLYSHAATVPIGPIGDRFRASRNWILCARRIRHPPLLRAHSIAINLLPQLAWIGLSLTHRYAELKGGADVVREAAAAALDSGFPELALEWLEQGRSIVWGELFQLRGSYEQLSSAHPDHARRLWELSAALDDAGATREKSLSTFSESADDPIHRAIETLQQVADTHRTLAIERDTLLQEIRRLPGFNRFLLQKKFSQLCTSAHSGPVVTLNAAETRCDALIVLADVDHGILKSFLRHALVERTGQVARWDHGTWESFLSPLWKCVVEPVMDALAFSTPGDLSRIFWCPTGPFDAKNPTDSGLCLADERRLKISDIIGLSRSRGGLAFLSACQTATGDEGLSDEAIHITAGMLFAGYGGVIGTMWSISDTLAPIVARDVYEHLFRNGTRPDYREAAWALHEAIGRQRDGELSFNEWVPFIHVGL